MSSSVQNIERVGLTANDQTKVTQVENDIHTLAGFGAAPTPPTAAAIAAAVAALPQGLFTVVGSGQADLSTANGGTHLLTITFHASTTCTYFRFWHAPGAGTCRFNPTGAADPTANDVQFDDSMGVTTLKITAATTLKVYVDTVAGAGKLNWIAGN
jgi:hypothetical protein